MWWAKVALKGVARTLPVSRHAWRRLGLFRHGDMDQPDYAFGVIEQHFGVWRRFGGHAPFVALELGPGDSLFSAVYCAAHGGRAILVDAEDAAVREPEPYWRFAAYLRSRGLASAVRDGMSFDEVVAACGARYLTGGDASLREIESASVDLVWSHTVLQHIPPDALDRTLRETRRLLRPGGVASHEVDLRDTITGSLNHLRYPPEHWASRWMARSGYYTNRLRWPELCDRFARAGFTEAWSDLRRWDEPPVPLAELDPSYRVHGDALRISVARVALTV